MKTLPTLGILLLVVGCSGGGGSGNGGGGATGACDFPSCVSAVLASCQPSGTCVRQSDANMTTNAYCFSSGVSGVTIDQAASYGWTTTYKKNGTSCYSVIEGDFQSTN